MDCFHLKKHYELGNLDDISHPLKSLLNNTHL